MQDDQLLADIGPEVLNGNAALWLGPAWQIPETNIAMRMSGLSWLAIWSESNGAEFASLLKDACSRSDRLRKRGVVEVAGRMSDALGSYYALSEVCPFFISVGERTRGIRCRRERRRARSGVGACASVEGVCQRCAVETRSKVYFLGACVPSGCT